MVGAGATRRNQSVNREARNPTIPKRGSSTTPSKGPDDPAVELQEHRSRQATDGVGAHSGTLAAAQDGLMREAEEVLFLEAKEHPRAARLFFGHIVVVAIDIFAFFLLF